ncbi:MFS transporter [Lactobacillus mulieris]|uniref:MFS transporter n=1 Tax=Lactobacillus mulieris TaxID=2508708 RepID=UPI0022435951|nr:MFS transporter [Lactobacillus mulieris]MCW8072944.1 MFS transporter [Lactobacillus mulieris]MDK6268543.1 MFS transporter [Lactobacillus mulieris]
MNVFLKNKSYRRFSIVSFLSGTGDILFYMALMTYASKLENYSLALSLIAISESLPKLLDTFSGYLADRTRKKFKNIFLMALIRFILYSLVGILFASKLSDWTLVLIVIVINLISDTFGSYAGGLVVPLIVNLVGEEDFGEAEGFTSGVSQVIGISAQFLGSGLLLFMSYSNLAFLNAFTFLFAGLLYASIGRKQKDDNQLIESQDINREKFLPTLKSSYNQVKKQPGLLTIVLVVALINGTLSALQSLIPIVMVAYKKTMIISNYSFTIAIIGIVVSSGFALGSICGPQLFKKATIFSIVITAIILSIATTIIAFIANIYIILPAYFILAATASLASIKLSQWLVMAVNQKILASSMGLLNTILTVMAPTMTTIFTTISGSTNFIVSMSILVIVEVIILFIAIKLNLTAREATTSTLE